MNVARLLRSAPGIREALGKKINFSLCGFVEESLLLWCLIECNFMYLFVVGLEPHAPHN